MQKNESKEPEITPKLQKKNLPKLSKDKWLKSERFINRADLLGAILFEEKQYTYDEVSDLIAKFLEMKVKI